MRLIKQCAPGCASIGPDEARGLNRLERHRAFPTLALVGAFLSQRCEADSIVTSNLKHFPKDVIAKWSIDVSGPSSFLIAMFDMQPAIVISKLDDMSADRSIERTRLLSILHKSVPGFSARVASDLGIELN